MKKEDFIIGKWYAHNPYNDLSRLWYVKFKNISNKFLEASEYITDNKEYYYREGIFNKNFNEYWSINISEIARLLPKDHPDLQNIERSYELW